MRIGPHPEILAKIPLFKLFRSIDLRNTIGSKRWKKDFDDLCQLHNDRCLACGSDGHEVDIDEKTKTKVDIYSGMIPFPLFNIDVDKYRFTFEKVIPLCEYCWKFCNIRMMKEWQDTGLISNNEFTKIRSKGYAVLRAAEIDKNEEFRYQVKGEIEWALPKCFTNKEWRKWHLLIKKKKIYSPYKSLKHYKKVHENPLLTDKQKLSVKDKYLKRMITI